MTWHKHAGSIALVAAAAGLAVYVYVDRGSVTDSERAMRPKNVFPAFRRDDLVRIEIVKADEKLLLTRDPKGDAGPDPSWAMEAPSPGPTDPAVTDELVGALEFASFLRKVEASSAPAFDAPRVSGSITMGKLSYRFALGGAAPTPEGASYFKVDGEGVYVVSKELTERLLKPAATYRSRTLVPYLSLDLASIEVKKDGDTLRLERTGELSFRLADSKLRASRETLDKLWSALAELRAESFLSDAEAVRLTQTPVATISMVTKNGKPAGELVLGAACPEHPDDVAVLRTAPTRVGACAPRGVLDGLSLKADDLVDTRLFFAHEDEIEELKLESAAGDFRIELARKGSGWHARAPFERDLAGDEVDAANTLASAVARSKGSDVVADRPEPFVLRARVSVHGGATKEDEVVELSGGSTWTARRKADGARLVLGSDVARRLMPSKSALKGRDVIVPSLDPKDVTAASLRCGTAQELTRDGSSWMLSSPRGYASDQAAALDVVEQITRLRAERWVADADDGSFGLSDSTCVVTLGAKAEGGARSVELRIGRDNEGGSYAVTTDHLPGAAASTGPIFFEPRTLRDSLARIFVDRSAVGIDATRASRIEIARDARHIVLVRVADRLTGPDAGLSVPLDTVTTALENLRAEEVVHLGPALADEGFASPSLDVRATLAGDAGAKEIHVRFGRDVLRKNQAVVLARIDGLDATFAIARERVDPIRNAL